MISIVQYSRNDNHGDNLLKRMKFSYYTNIYLLEKYKIKSEIIMVDYNTPTNKDNLYKLLPINQKLNYVNIRHIIVPPEIHSQFKESDKLPMNNMLARNIGIRRAKGEYILSTGIDVIFSPKLVKKFNTTLPDKLYRVNRYDVNSCILDMDLNYEEILIACEKNIIDIHFNTNQGNFIPNTTIPMLHTNNCGDFQLAHKNIWFKLRGYPEIDLMGTHVDTIFEYMAYLSGFKEVVLEEKLFHIDHKSRWLKPLYTHVLRNWRMLFKEFGYDVMQYKEDYYKLAKKISKNANEKTYLEEIDLKILTDNEYKQIIADMANGKRNIVFNNGNWGAGDKKFEEIILS
jgi:hypothetical protein